MDDGSAAHERQRQQQRQRQQLSVYRVVLVSADDVTWTACLGRRRRGGGPVADDRSDLESVPRSTSKHGWTRPERPRQYLERVGNARHNTAASQFHPTSLVRSATRRRCSPVDRWQLTTSCRFSVDFVHRSTAHSTRGRDSAWTSTRARLSYVCSLRRQL